MAFEGAGFLQDVLARARQPIREAVAGFNGPDPLSGDVPSWLGTLDKYNDPLHGSPSVLFGPDPLRANPFLNTLTNARPTSSPADFMQMFGRPSTPSTGVLAQAIARAQGQKVPTAPQPQPGGQGAIARAIAGANKPPPSGGGPRGATATDASLDPAFAQAAEAEGVPLDYLKALAATENSAADSISPQGARGLMQVVPGQGYDHPGEDWSDPAISIRQGARALKAKYQQTGSWDEAVRAYFGYGTDAGGVTTDQYSNIFQQNLERVHNSQQTTAKPAEAAAGPLPPQGARPLRGITPAQYGSEGLATGAANYICGPVAAEAFLRSQGRNPTLQETLDLARGLGYIDPTNGMHGIDSTIDLIRKLGGVATKGEADTNRMAQEVMAGRPVIVNTRLHYFVAEGYDPTTGRFDFGNSAAALRSSGGRTQYTLGELANLTIGDEAIGAPRGAIYAGN